jgi:hypothetical protein
LQILKLRPNLAWHLREGGEIELKLSPQYPDGQVREKGNNT